MGCVSSVGGSATSGEGLTALQVAAAIRTTVLAHRAPHHETQNVEPVNETLDGRDALYSADLSNTNIQQVDGATPASHVGPAGQVLNDGCGCLLTRRTPSEVLNCCKELEKAAYDEISTYDVDVEEVVEERKVCNKVCVAEYAPRVFQFIRHIGCVDDDLFAEEWMLSEEQLRLEMGEGRSQALFLKSKSMSFMCKTVAEHEVHMLRRILQSYVKHISSYTNSLLMRFYMLLKVSVGGNSGYLLCFADVYSGARKLNEKWDIKGRIPKPGKFRYFPHHIQDVYDPTPYVIDTSHEADANIGVSRAQHTEERLKDGHAVMQQSGGNVKRGVRTRHDKDLTRLFWLDKSVRGRLLTQLARDYSFLSDMGLMDYSLLVGVSYNDTRLTRFGRPYVALYNVTCFPEQIIESGVEERPVSAVATAQNATHYQCLSEFAEGVPSLFEQEIYYIGVIDMLTSYDIKKKAANFFKSFLWRDETLSTIPPAAYKARLQRYTKIIFPEVN